MKGSALRQLRSLCNLDYMLVVAGMTFLWPILRAPFRLTALSVSPVAGFSPQSVFDLFLVLSGLVLLAAVPAFIRVLGGLRAKACLSCASGIICASGVALLFLASSETEWAAFLMFSGACLLSIGVAMIFTMWGIRLVCLEFGALCCCVTLSYLASFLLGMFDYFEQVLRVLCFALPIGSAGILGLSFIRSHSFASSNEEPLSEEAEGEGKALRGHVGNRMLLVFLVVGLLASAVVRSLWMHSSSGYQMSSGLIPTYLISVGLAASYVLVAFALKDKGLGMLVGVTLTMVVLLLGILLCAIVEPRAGLGAVASSHTSFEFLLWSYLLLASFGHMRSIVRGMGLWLVAEGFTSVLAQLLIPRLLGIDAETSSDLAVFIALISMTLIAASFIGLAIMLSKDALSQRLSVTLAPDDLSLENPTVEPFDGGERTLSRELGGRTSVEEMAFDEALANELLNAYGLTERESQVAACMARGNSVKRAAELMFLAPSTVQGYTKIIYRKMGINSKQSLIDIASSYSRRS